MSSQTNEIALFDASGRRIKRPGMPPPTGVPAKAPADPAAIEALFKQLQIDRPEPPTILSPRAHACLELKAAAVSFIFQVTADLNTSPFAVLEGSIGGDICTVSGTIGRWSGVANLAVPAS